VVKFTLPRCYDAGGWHRLIDTNDPDLPEQRFKVRASYLVPARSLLLFERTPAETKPRARPQRGPAKPPPQPST